MIERKSIHLDFCVIGAQKAGTTLAFSILKQSDHIFLPNTKEYPFLIMPQKDIGQWNPRGAKKAGTCTPQYLGNPWVADKMSDAFPNIKLIAILRDPLQRLVSHYNMMIRTGREKRSLNDAISESITIDLPSNGEIIDDTRSYVSSGLYAKCLQPFYKNFPDRQILLLDFAQVQNDLGGFSELITKFLDIPKIQKIRYDRRMQGGSARRINFDFDLSLKRGWKFLERFIFGENIKNKIRYEGIRLSQWIMENNVSPGTGCQVRDIDPKLKLALLEIYSSDYQALKDQYNFEGSWFHE